VDESGKVISATIEHSKSGQADARLVKIESGREYEVQPPNQQKLRHRGRRCTVVGWVLDDIGNPMKVSVRFGDNGRRGRVDLEDLIEVAPTPVQ
jgi:hypothetical protein